MLKIKRILTYLVAISSGVTVSCSKDHSTSHPCFPSQIATTFHLTNGQTVSETVAYQYDDKMNLVSVTDKNGTLTFTYTDGKITSTASTASQGAETWTYNNNGTVSHINGSYPSGSAYPYAEDLSYDGNGNLTSVVATVASNNASLNFTFKNGNVATFVSLQNNGHVLRDSINYSTYDSKNSPYAALGKAMGNQSFYIPASVTTIVASSKNNPTVSSSVYEGKSTYVYEYNSNGYPTKITTTNEDGTTQEDVITYAGCE